MSLRSPNENVISTPISVDELIAKLEKIQKIQADLVTLMSALNSVALIAETDPDGKIIFVNELFTHISKFESHELIGKTFALFKSEHQKEELYSDMWKAISEGKAWTGVFKNKAADGSFYWVESTIIPQLNSKNVIKKYISISFEITEVIESGLQNPNLHLLPHLTPQHDTTNQQIQLLTQQIQRFQHENTSFHSALNQCVMISETDKRGVIININDRMALFTGYPKHELLGQNHRLLKSEETPLETFDQLWQTISAGSVWRGILQNIKHDGSPYWVDITITPIVGSEGKIEKYISIAFDITSIYNQAHQNNIIVSDWQQKHDELTQHLIEKEKYLNELEQVQLLLFAQVTALNNSAIVSETDIKGDFILVNDHYCKISGFNKEELIGKNHQLIKSGAHSSEFYEQLWLTLKAGNVWTGIFHNKNKAGEKYSVFSTITPILDDNGAITKFVSIQYDISSYLQESDVLHRQIKNLDEEKEQLQIVNTELHRRINDLETLVEQSSSNVNTLLGEITFDLNGNIESVNTVIPHLFNQPDIESFKGTTLDNFIYSEFSDTKTWSDVIDKVSQITQVSIQNTDKTFSFFAVHFEPIYINEILTGYTSVWTPITEIVNHLRHEKDHFEAEVTSLSQILQISQAYLLAYKNIGLSIELTKSRLMYAFNQRVFDVSGYDNDTLASMPLDSLFTTETIDKIPEEFWNTSVENTKWIGRLTLRTTTNNLLLGIANISPIFKNGELYRYVLVYFSAGIEQEQLNNLKEEVEQLHKSESANIQKLNSFLFDRNNYQRQIIELENQIKSADANILKLNSKLSDLQQNTYALETFDIERNNLVQTIIQLQHEKDEIEAKISDFETIKEQMNQNQVNFDSERNQLLDTIAQFAAQNESYYKQKTEAENQYNYLSETLQNNQLRLNQLAHIQNELLEHNANLTQTVQALEQQLVDEQQQTVNTQLALNKLNNEKTYLTGQIEALQASLLSEVTSKNLSHENNDSILEEKLNNLQNQLQETQKLADDYKFSENTLRLKLKEYEDKSQPDNGTLLADIADLKSENRNLQTQLHEFINSEAERIHAYIIQNDLIPRSSVLRRDEDAFSNEPFKQPDDSTPIQLQDITKDVAINTGEFKALTTTQKHLLMGIADWQLQEEISNELNTLGISYNLASYARDLFDLYDTKKPTHILIEPRLNDLNAFEILDIIRNDYADETVKVIALLSPDMSNYKNEYLNNGFTDVWFYPIRFEQLV